MSNLDYSWLEIGPIELRDIVLDHVVYKYIVRLQFKRTSSEGNRVKKMHVCKNNFDSK